MPNCRLLLTSAVVWLLMILYGCGTPMIATQFYGDPTSSVTRILIASERTEFKTAVVNELLDQLPQQSCYIKLIDITQLKYETHEDYDLVILLNSCMAWRPDPLVTGFVATAKNRDKFLVLTTANDKHCRFPMDGVDAITSASNPDQTLPVIWFIQDKVRFFLN